MKCTLDIYLNNLVVPPENVEEAVRLKLEVQLFWWMNLKYKGKSCVPGVWFSFLSCLRSVVLMCLGQLGLKWTLASGFNAASVAPVRPKRLTNKMDFLSNSTFSFLPCCLVQVCLNWRVDLSWFTFLCWTFWHFLHQTLWTWKHQLQLNGAVCVQVGCYLPVCV